MYYSLSYDDLCVLKSSCPLFFEKLRKDFSIIDSDEKSKMSNIIEIAEKVNLFSQNCFSCFNSKKKLCILNGAHLEECFVQSFLDNKLSLEKLEQRKNEYINVQMSLFESSSKTYMSYKDIINISEASFSFKDNEQFLSVFNEFILSVSGSNNNNLQNLLITPDAFLLIFVALIVQSFEKMMAEGIFDASRMRKFIELLLLKLIDKVYLENCGFSQHLMFVRAIFCIKCILHNFDELNIEKLKLKVVSNESYTCIASSFCVKDGTRFIDQMKNIYRENYNLYLYHTVSLNSQVVKHFSIKMPLWSFFVSKASDILRNKWGISFHHYHNCYISFFKDVSLNIPYVDFFIKHGLKDLDLYDDIISQLLIMKDDGKCDTITSFLEVIYRVNFLGYTPEEAYIKVSDKIEDREDKVFSVMKELIQQNNRHYAVGVDPMSVVRLCLCILNCQGLIGKRGEMLRICWDMKATLDLLKSSKFSLTLLEEAEHYFYIAQAGSLIVYYSIPDIKSELLPGLVYSVFASIFPECFSSELSAFREEIGMMNQEHFQRSQLFLRLITMCDN